MVSPAFPEQQFQQQLGARVRPQPSGLTIQDILSEYPVDPTAMFGTTPQTASPSLASLPTEIATELGSVVASDPVVQAAGGVAGGVMDIFGRLLNPQTSPFAGKGDQPYSPMFSPESLWGGLGRGIASGFTGGYPEGPIDHRSLSGPEQALYFADIADPSGVGGDILRPLAKAIPEGALAGGFLGGWFMPKNIKKTKATSRLEDMWKHPVFTRDKWAPNPSVEEIRTIGAQSLYLDDASSGIKNTSPQTYMNMGRGNQTMEQAIRRATSDPFRGSPGSLQKQSDSFNRYAKELRGDLGDEAQFNRYDWYLDRQDTLTDSYDFDPNLFDPDYLDARGGYEYSQVADEFERISGELKEEAQASQKWIDIRTNQVIDEETKIMERGLKEYTGKGMPGGGSGTIPPQGTGGVLPGVPELPTLLPKRVQDSITRVRQAVDEGIEKWAKSPKEPTVEGIPTREIPSDFRAGYEQDIQGIYLRPHQVDDVKLEVALEAEADRSYGLWKEMQRRGVELTPDMRGQIDAAQEALANLRGGSVPRGASSRENSLLFDAIAEQHGGKAVLEVEDIMADVTGNEFDVTALMVDWDAMGSPERGIQANRDWDQIIAETRRLLFGTD